MFSVLFVLNSRPPFYCFRHLTLTATVVCLLGVDQPRRFIHELILLAWYCLTIVAKHETIGEEKNHGPSRPAWRRIGYRIGEELPTKRPLCQTWARMSHPDPNGPPIKVGDV